MAIDPTKHYTVTCVTYENVEAGSYVSATHPTATLTLTPDPGYLLNYEDFSITGSLPASVLSIVFVQNGNGVNCIVTFLPGFVMPSANLDIALCIDGQARFNMFNVEGLIDPVNTDNLTIDPPVPFAFANVGAYGDVSLVYNVYIMADAGYYFNDPPVILQISGEIDLFNITVTSDSDLNGNVVAYSVVIECIFPHYNSFDNNFLVRIGAAPIYSPLTKITNYIIDSTFVPMPGDVRTITLIGGEGAEWTLANDYLIFVDPTTKLIVDVLSGVIDNSGIAEITIVIPEQSVSTEYNIELSSRDLIEPFPVPTTIVLEQLLDVTIRATIPASSTFTILPVDANISRTYLAMSTPPSGVGIAEGSITCEVTSAHGNPLILLRQPNISDILYLEQIVKLTVGDVVDYGTITVDDTTDLEIGMDLITPLQHINNSIVNIDTGLNKIALTYPVTLPENTGVSFSNDKRNLTRYTMSAEQIDAYQINVTLALAIGNFGYADKDFPLIISNFIAED